MGLIDHHLLMVRYNRFMNDKLIALMQTLSQSELHLDRGAFFNSIYQTADHILGADILWLKRIANHPKSARLAPILDVKSPISLDAPMFDDLALFVDLRQKLDSLFESYIADLSEADLATNLTFTRINGDCHTKPLGLILSHVFNHQTHHRGQITTLLSQIGLAIGVTDVITLVPDIEI